MRATGFTDTVGDDAGTLLSYDGGSTWSDASDSLTGSEYAAVECGGVTATQPSGPGHITIYPCNQPRPNASNLNYTTGQTIAASATIPLAPDGTICIHTPTTTHLIIDANAYVT